MPRTKWNFVVPFVQTMYELTKHAEHIILFLMEMDSPVQSEIHEIISEAMLTLVTLEKHFDSESPVVRKHIVREILIIQNNMLQLQILVECIFKNLLSDSADEGNNDDNARRRVVTGLWSVLYIVLGKMVGESYQFCKTIRSPKVREDSLSS
jgi:hypothetical protein